MFYNYNSGLIKPAKENRKDMTEYESIFWDMISKSKTGYVFRRQKPIGNFIVDFYCEKLKIVIEIDGEYHNENGFVERDIERSDYLRSLGIRIIRYKNEEIRSLTINKIEEDMLLSFNAPLGELPDRAEGVELIVVIGPTSSGKSDRAVDLAIELDGEVISADSRQVYEGLDVGTGKITKQEMRGVRHYLLSYMNPPLSRFWGGVGGEGVYSVSRWVRDAKEVIDDIISRGKIPIVCGGTGMYIYSLIYGLDHDVAPDHDLRDRLNKLNTTDLFNKYKEEYVKFYKQPLNLDDKSITNNRPRLIRAIEIYQNSHKQNLDIKKSRQPLYNVKYIHIDRSMDELRERVTKRAEIRLDAMIEETRNLIAGGVDIEWLSRVGIEYGVIIKYLNKEIDIEEMKSNIILRSLQYAKRQRTWNKKYFNQ